MNLDNPDLPSTAAQLAALGAGADPLLAQGRVFVPPLAAKTAPYEQHKAEEPAYFLCSLKTASMHRGDGKKLPFVNGMLKTDVLEDIQYLRAEVYQHMNPYVREASAAEVDIIEATLNPRAALKNSVMKEMGAEMEAEIQRRVAAQVAALGVNTDAAKIAGVDGEKSNPVPDGKTVQVIPINPVNSTTVAAISAGGESAAARAAAALAALSAAKPK